MGCVVIELFKPLDKIGRFRYVGRESMVEIATYTTEVVRRQMMKISREFKKRNNFIMSQNAPQAALN